MPGWAARWTRIFLPRWVIARSYYFLHLLLVTPKSKLIEGRGFMASTDSYLDAFFKLSTADCAGRVCLQCQWLWNVLQYLQDYPSGELFLPDATVISFLSANQSKVSPDTGHQASGDNCPQFNAALQNSKWHTAGTEQILADNQITTCLMFGFPYNIFKTLALE